MIIFKDAETGDELFTDACCPKLSDCQTYYSFQSKLTEQKEGEIDDKLIGGNASAEEQQEQMEACVKRGLDFALRSKLEPFDFGDKKLFMKFLKEFFVCYKKHHLEKHPELTDDDHKDELTAFESRLNAFGKLLVSKFKDAEFFFGENDMEKKHSFCAAVWNEDGMSATVYVFRGCLAEEKY